MSAAPPPVRAAVRRLAPYRPPLEGRRGLRLDFNENPLGCSPRALAALAAIGADDLAQYPEYEAAEAELAQFFGHTRATLLATNGVDDAIALAAQAFLDAGDETIVVAPTYAMYRHYAALAAAEVVELRMREQGGAFTLDRAALAAAIGRRTRLVFLANPNNPTGTHTPADELLRLIAGAPDCAFFVDEAYADFLPAEEPTLVAHAGDPPNLLVARTFSKLHGLAGARLGVLAAHAEIVAELRKAHSPYAVNTLALRCGRAALADASWAEECRRQTTAARARLEAALDELRLPRWPSAANFVLFDAGDGAAELLAAARDAGVLLRDRGGDRPSAVRISCGSLAQTERAIAVLRAWRGRAAAPSRPAAARPALAFDLDGVLVDERGSYRRAIAATVRQLGGGEVSADDIQALRDEGGYNNDWDSTAELLRRRGRAASRELVVGVFEAFYHGPGEDGLWRHERWLIPAAELAALAERYRLAIFTGRPRADALRTLAASGMADYFERLVGLEDVRHGKPDAEGLRLLRQWAGSGGLLAYCGDTVDDAACARAAGVAFVGVIPPDHAAPAALARRWAALGCIAVGDGLMQALGRFDCIAEAAQ